MMILLLILFIFPLFFSIIEEMSGEDIKNDIDKVQLKKSLSLASACSIIIGTIVGSGIFITPSSVLNNAGTFH